MIDEFLLENKKAVMSLCICPVPAVFRLLCLSFWRLIEFVTIFYSEKQPNGCRSYQEHERTSLIGQLSPI